MKVKKNFISSCNNININLIIGFVLLLIVILFYNNINDFIKYIIKSISGNIIEGYMAQTIDDIVSCNSASQQLSCGTTSTTIQTYTPYLGTCDETYGPLSQTPNDQLLSTCVDEPMPTIGTPLGNQESSVTSSACNLLNHRSMDLKRIANTQNEDGTPCT